MEDIKDKNYVLDQVEILSMDSENSDHFDYDTTLEGLGWYDDDEYPRTDEYDWKFSESDCWD